MNEKRFFDDLSERINEALRNSPAQDIEKNLRALLASWFDRMDLVMREDFEVQKKLLEVALARVAALEARLEELERRSGGNAEFCQRPLRRQCSEIRRRRYGDDCFDDGQRFQKISQHERSSGRRLRDWQYRLV